MFMYNTFKHIRYHSKQLELLLAMQLCVFMQSLSFYLIPLRFVVCLFFIAFKTLRISLAISRSCRSTPFFVSVFLYSTTIIFCLR